MTESQNQIPIRNGINAPPRRSISSASPFPFRLSSDSVAQHYGVFKNTVAAPADRRTGAQGATLILYRA